ncbi:glycerol kinase [Sporanaerobium hydrogeniformans]|uniref:Glycerol kinase n=1 Tax=Sporanaerobium hydrogeniformans TaxID=3072179 RepID=A0AC61DDY4_9FIRM|nr:glycerol kinase GlpK [Sporanaerobium hydrogeniformans]PHV70832.1 glycerol kinase [Sporanaerobium hydrogeniformans]
MSDYKKEEKYIVALDQGTTSSRAILFDKNQNIIGISQKEFMQIYPKEGWVEHDPMEIWASQYGVLQEVMAKANLTQENIAALGITNQRETIIVWDKETGKPIYNAIVWQCRRTAEFCDQLREQGWEDYIKKTTGLVLDAYFSASKIKWILDHVEGAKKAAQEGKLLCGTVDSWLVWKLTNGKVHVTDYTNASRTMLFNIKQLKWDERLLQLFDIPRSMLPEVKNSSEVYGTTNLGAKGGIRVPIAGIAGDQQAALFGQGCFEKGNVKNTYGTGCFVLMNTGKECISSKNGLLTTIAIGLNGEVEYALEGSVFIGGATVQWLRDELHLVNEACDTAYFANKVQDSGGVYVVPAFVGLGAPYWDMYARGGVLGLTRGSNRNHIIRASLEAIGYQSRDVMDAMVEDVGHSLSSIKVDGGASKNDFLMQFQADITGANVVRPIVTETTALGAAYLAGLAIGYWKDKKELLEAWRVDKTFVPVMEKEIRAKKYRGWKKAIKRCMEWEIEDKEEF